MFLLSVLLLMLVGPAKGFASWFIKDFCDRQLIAGEIIMNAPVIYSDERSIRILRGSEDITRNGEYIPGEELTVQISDVTPQFVIEISNGQIVGGGCDGKRIADKSNVVVIMPLSGQEVLIWAGWATGHSAVSITDVFTFRAPIAAVLNSSHSDKVETASQADSREQESEGVAEPAMAVHRDRAGNAMKGAKQGRRGMDVPSEDLETSSKSRDRGLRGRGQPQQHQQQGEKHISSEFCAHYCA